ncbi:MAG: GNAT family N-acetyltransferase [Oscillospiraceae bacterium]|nr:GNAT family N-acetyltransferase [Oscillospiraceae bacterium]
MKCDIKKVEKEEIPQLAKLANEIWHQHFPTILTEEQIDYMVLNFQSEKAMNSQLENGYEYYFMNADGDNQGYFGIQPQEDGTLFLSKLYLRKSYRGNGFARQAFEFMKDICKERGYKSIWLTVNKHNDDTIAIYKRFGMEIIRSQVADIGNGFVMDDYVFEYKI